MITNFGRTVLAALLFAGLFPRGASAEDVRAAEAAIQEGQALMRDRQYDRAVDAMSKAVEAAPGWAHTWTMRAFAKAQAEKPISALEDLSKSLELKPGDVSVMNLRARVLMDLDQWQEAAEQAAAALKLMPGEPYAQSLEGRARIQTGDVDGGIEELRSAIKQRPDLSSDLADGLFIKGDWTGSAAAAESAFASGDSPAKALTAKGFANIELGNRDAVLATIAQIDRELPGAVAAALVRAAWWGTPSGKDHNLAEALKQVDLAYSGTSSSIALNVHARVLILNGRAQECLELLSTRGRRTNFETLFWLGASYWKLGMFAEARGLLMDARRRNPYLIAHAKRVEGLADFVAAIDSELSSENKGAERGRLGFELATHLLTVAEIEALVRRYRFESAVKEYEKLLAALKSSVRKAEVEERLPEVKGMAGAMKRLAAAINKGTLKPKATIGKVELAIVKAGELDFDFTIPKGEGKFPWACLDPDLFCDLAMQAGAVPPEQVGLGCIAWDAGRVPTAAKLFEAAAKKDVKLRPLVDAFIARRRGVPAPAGGFIWFRNQYVTPDEKANLEKGLVRWEDKWVAPKDREQLAKGRTKVGDAWMDATEADLLARGFRRFEGAWLSPEEVAAKRSDWANAWTEETTHYSIRTNQGESFAKELSLVVEAAWTELKKYYRDAEPRLNGKEKMTLFAFRTFEDYRRYCVENKAEEQLAAAGFARSDSNVVVGWNKTSNPQQFLQTMVHEAAHLYAFRVAPAAHPPSWYVEGTATLFEGFAWDGKGFRFNFVSESRLPFVRDAVKAGTAIPLKELFEGNALQLINSDLRKALLFYAQAWSLAFWLSTTDDPRYRKAWKEYREGVDKGGAEPLFKFIGDPVQFEKDWARFVSGL